MCRAETFQLINKKKFPFTAVLRQVQLKDAYKVFDRQIIL